MTRRERREIEWHFINHGADVALYLDWVQEILDEGLTAQLAYTGRGSLPGNPTEGKALRLAALSGDGSWAAVIRNTFSVFRFHPSYAVMKALYMDRKKKRDIIEEYFKGGALETTFWRWRNKWLHYAYQWAKEYGLL